MSQKLQVNLNHSPEQILGYTKDNASMMQLSVQLPKAYRETYSETDCTVCIAISVDGMLGLGMELVRCNKDIDNHNFDLWSEMMPIGSSATEYAGVCLTHDSCVVLLGEDEIDNYLEQIRHSKNYHPTNKVIEIKDDKNTKNDFFSGQIKISNTLDDVFEFDLMPMENASQPYNENDANLLQVIVKCSGGEIISSSYSCFISLTLSRDGMLGFGTELIRKAMRLKAMNKKELPMERLEPIGPNGGSSGSLGVYLTHDSCSLEFTVKDLGTIDEQLELAEKEWQEKQSKS